MRRCFTIVPLLLTALFALGTLLGDRAAAQEPFPQLFFSEHDGELRAWTPMASGSRAVDGLQWCGQAVTARISVLPGDDPLRRVHSFRFESWGEEIALANQLPGMDRVREGFGAYLEPTSSPHRYGLRLDWCQVVDGQPVYHQTTLRRGFGNFYLSFSDGGAAPIVYRAKTLAQMMLEHATAYHAFEEKANQCSLRGVALVPRSRYSPTVIHHVMGAPIVLLAPPERAAWQRLVAQLDDDAYKRRDAATQALLRAGAAVVPFLEGLDNGELSLEQRARIQYIVRAFAEDMPPEPQPLESGELEQLQREPPASWLAHLILSAEDEVRSWAADRLHRVGLIIDLPREPNRDERTALFRYLMAEIGNSE